ncbi:MAG: YciI family protein [Pseudomonadota bacterium]
MRFAVFFEDDPGKTEMRAAYMAAHLAFLEQSADEILAAGPMTENGSAAGGLWLVEAADERAVRDLVETDPFWPTGLRKSLRIFAWRQVFADGRRLP